MPSQISPFPNPLGSAAKPSLFESKSGFLQPVGLLSLHIRELIQDEEEIAKALNNIYEL